MQSRRDACATSYIISKAQAPKKSLLIELLRYSHRSILDFMAKLTVRDLDVRGKRVFVRVDYNVPLEEKNGEMVITDTTRIVETLPTLRLLIERGAKVILAAHLGRPKGKREPSMSLRPIAFKLHELIGQPVE